MLINGFHLYGGNRFYKRSQDIFDIQLLSK